MQKVRFRHGFQVQECLILLLKVPIPEPDQFAFLFLNLTLTLNFSFNFFAYLSLYLSLYLNIRNEKLCSNWARMLVFSYFMTSPSEGTRHQSIFAKLFVKYRRWLCFTTFSCLAFCTSRLIVNTLFWHFLTFLLLLMVWPFKGGNIFTLPIITSQEPVLGNNLDHTQNQSNGGS